MKQVWKRRAVVAAVLMLVGTSVYLNWRYAGTVEDSGKKVLGQSALVNGETTDAEVTPSLLLMTPRAPRCLSWPRPPPTLRPIPRTRA